MGEVGLALSSGEIEVVLSVVLCATGDLNP